MRGHLVLLLMIICVYAHAAQLPGGCPFEDEILPPGEHFRRCERIICEDGEMTMIPCAVYQCPEGKLIGYQETDFSKPYPECCEGPICKEEES